MNIECCSPGDFAQVIAGLEHVVSRVDGLHVKDDERNDAVLVGHLEPLRGPDHLGVLIPGEAGRWVGRDLNHQSVGGTERVIVVKNVNVEFFTLCISYRFVNL